MRFLCYLFTFLFFSTFYAKNKAHEKHFVVIIPSYNNQEWVKQNLTSVFDQNYSNYEIVYIDDCSTDNTFEKVLSITQENQQEHRVKIIRNMQRKGALANLYHAIHACDNDAIIVCLDGDDWLSGPHVLATLNNYYTSENIWLTYGNYRIYQDNTWGICSEYAATTIATNNYRYDCAWRASHLRTFYAGLFKKIKLEDLLYKGNFYTVAWDLGLMFPMLEMSGGKFAFIQEPLYIYNRNNPLNDFRCHELEQIQIDYFIRSKPAYAPIKRLEEGLVEQKIDVIVFSHDHPKKLAVFLYTLYKYLKDIGTIIVLYTPTYYPWKRSTQYFEHAYKNLISSFPNVLFIKQEWGSVSKSLEQCLTYCSHKYCLITHDVFTIKKNVDGKECITMLEKTQSYAFYLSMQATDFVQEALVWLNDEVAAWQFESMPEYGLVQNNFTMTIYTKELLERLLD